MGPNGAKFLVRLLLGGILVAAIGSVLLYLAYGRDAAVSWWIGAGISLANCFWGTLLMMWGIGRSNTAVIGVVCGGFFGRLVLASVAFYLLWGLPGIHGVVLALSIVGFYFVGMILEMQFLHKHVFHAGPARGGNGGPRASR